MNTNTLLIIGGMGLVAYFLYKQSNPYPAYNAGQQGYTGGYTGGSTVNTNRATPPDDSWKDDFDDYADTGREVIGIAKDAYELGSSIYESFSS